MNMHEQFAEDLALHAIEALQGDELAALQGHLQSCAECRRELEFLRGDASLLAMSTTGSAPPRRARQRLLDAVAAEPRHISSAVSGRHGFWTFAPWFATAAAAILVVLLLQQNNELKKNLAAMDVLFKDQSLQLQRAEDVVATLTAPESQQVTMVAAKNPPQPQGKTFYLRNKGTLLFLANNLPQLPPEKIYELWLIPKTGAPVAAGLFKPDRRGGASVVNPPLPPGVEAKTFAVTLEPDAGSHEAPRGTFVIVGVGE
jgi:anti-sigma-K factor RskA